MRFDERTRELSLPLSDRDTNHISSGRKPRSQPTFSRTRSEHRSRHKCCTYQWRRPSLPHGRSPRGGFAVYSRTDTVITGTETRDPHHAISRGSALHTYIHAFKHTYIRQGSLVGRALLLLTPSVAHPSHAPYADRARSLRAMDRRLCPRARRDRAQRPCDRHHRHAGRHAQSRGCALIITPVTPKF